MSVAGSCNCGHPDLEGERCVSCRLNDMPPMTKESADAIREMLRLTAESLRGRSAAEVVGTAYGRFNNDARLHAICERTMLTIDADQYAKTNLRLDRKDRGLIKLAVAVALTIVEGEVKG